MSERGYEIINKEKQRPLIDYGRWFNGDMVWYWRCNICLVGLLNAQDEANMLLDLLTHANDERHKMNVMVLENNLRGGNDEYIRFKED